MFGSNGRRPSSDKKPLTGWSHFYPSAGANRTPAKDVRSINPAPTSSVRKKTADELFREHKEAAIAWAAQRKGQETPVLVAAPKEEVHNLPPTPANWRPENKPLQVPAPSMSIPIVQVTSPVQHNLQTSQAQRSWMPKGDATYRATGSPCVHSQSSPQESVFARFKKEADAKEHSALLSPFSSKYDNNIASESLPEAGLLRTDAKVVPEEKSHTLDQRIDETKTFKEKLLDAFGITSLKYFERSLLLGLLVLSPALVYLAERVFLSHIAPTGANGVVAVMSVYNRTYTELSTMSLRDLAVASALAVVLSAVFDRNTRATDAQIRQAWANLVSYVASNKVHFSSTASESIEHDETSGNQGATWSLMQSVLSVFARIPLFVRFAVTILLFGGAFNVVMGKVVEEVSEAAVQYASMLCVLVLLLVCAVIGFVSARFALRQRASHRRVVKTVAAVVKALLQQRCRAYPIRYLYEEVVEVVTQSHPHSAAANSLLPIFSPAKLTKPAVVFDTHGAVEEPLLCGSPLGLSNSSKEHLLQASVKEATFGNDETSAGCATAANQKDVLEGYKLAKVWAAVQQAVESDPRIQRLDLIMDGKKQSCWRLLTGSTQANI
eukprot:gene9131-10778_t